MCGIAAVSFSDTEGTLIMKSTLKTIISLVLSAMLILSAGCSSSQPEAISDEEMQPGEVIFELDDTTESVIDDNVQNDDSSTKKSEFRLLFAGDYIIYDSTYNYAAALANGSGYNFKPMVRLLRPFTERNDLCYYNQETILGGEKVGLSSYPCFCSPQQAGDAMVDLGFNLVSTATNHTFDAGEEGILESYKYWQKQDGVFMTGSFDSQSSRDEVHVLECNGVTYSMLNYTYGLNGFILPEGKEYLVNVWPCDFTSPETDSEYQAYKKQVKKDIDAVRDKVDFLMVCMHAGVEYSTNETDYQRDMAKYLADCGVNLVIGTHPHVIEPAEYIGDTLVYYSLGNLFCAQMQDEYYNKVTSVMAELTVKKVIENGEIKIVLDDLNNELMYCYYNQATWTDYLIVPFSSPDIKKFLPEYKDVYEHYKEIFLQNDSSLPVAPCAK